MKIVTFKWDPLPNQETTLPSQRIIKYSPDHVHTFFSMCDENVDIPYEKICITDDPEGIDSSITIIPLWNICRDMGGCWNRLYVWSEDMKNIIGDRFLCMDLDVIILKNITNILERKEDCVLYLQQDCPDYPHKRWNGSMFMMNAGARDSVWREFSSAPAVAKSIVKKYHLVGTDQAWLLYHLGLDEAHWSIKDGIYDMRQHIIDTGRKEPPEDARIITWPGPRDPSEEKWHKLYPWITEYYRC